MYNKRSFEAAPLFVIGHPKSGTSLLMALLDAHPELIVIPEESDFFSMFYPYWQRERQRNPGWTLNDAALALSEMSHLRNFSRGQVEDDIGGNFDYSEFELQAYRQCLASMDPSQPVLPETLLPAIAQAYHAGSHASLQKRIAAANNDGNNKPGSTSPKPKYWVEKTAMHSWQLHRIVGHFPFAKFLIVVRDPRDNFVSYIKKLPYMSAPRFCAGWNAALVAMHSLGETQTLWTRYEDLISDLDGSLQRIRNFLAIEDHHALKTPSKFGHLWRGNSMFGQQASSVSSHALKRYLDYRPEADIRFVEACSRTGRQQLGYPEHFHHEASLKEQWRYQIAATRHRAEYLLHDWTDPWRRRIRTRGHQIDSQSINENAHASQNVA